jgi:hypothetical protein
VGIVQPVANGSLAQKPSNRHTVFGLACWFLGVMAFVQLLVAGMALAARFEDAREVRIIEREVSRPVVVRVPMAESVRAPAEPPLQKPAPPPVPTALEPRLQATPLSVPQVADPRSERLVDEARRARISGDMGRAIVKLEQSLEQSPDDPTVLYELGLVHEQMGVYDTAAAHYQKVFQMGVAGAGSLYEMAAIKLREGFDQTDTMLGKLSLGRVRIFNNPGHQDGQQVILTIPVQKSPSEDVVVEDIAVTVSFFNRTGRGEIVQLEDISWVVERWVTLPFDWAGGEENLRMIYTIPPQDPQARHLFGTIEYYGQVVSLTYKGEVLDVQAWPRDLAARIPQSRSPLHQGGLPPEFQDMLPLDFDPEMPLLPALPALD